MNEEFLKNKLGIIILCALHDSNIFEVLLNPDGRLWMLNQAGWIEHDSMSAHTAMALVQAVTQFCGLYLNERNPTLVCSLPFNNERISISIPPVTCGVSFNIRKPSFNILTLEHYVLEGVLSESQSVYLQQSIQNKQNILVSGGPGSGKTTLTNALLKQIADDMPYGHRVLILEDTQELQCQVPNHLCMKTTETRSMRDLIKQALRSAPNGIVVGEVVDGAALDLLKAWNVGCGGGLATIHANSAVATLQRLEDLAQEVSLTPPKYLIGESVDIIVHLTAESTHPAGRVVTAIIEVTCFDVRRGEYCVRHIH